MEVMDNKEIILSFGNTYLKLQKRCGNEYGLFFFFLDKTQQYHNFEDGLKMILRFKMVNNEVNNNK